MKKCLTYFLFTLLLAGLIGTARPALADTPPAEALVLVDATTPAEMDAAVEFIATQGGVVGLTFAPHALLVQLPPAGAADWVGQAGIAAVRTGPVDAEAIAAAYDDQAGQAARLWNQWQAPPPPPPPAPPGATPSDDVRIAPPPPPGEISLQNAPQSYQTSEYMSGLVQVDLFLPESSGNSENWSSARIANVVSEVGAGLNWWATTATQGGRPGANLSFNVTVHDPFNEPATVATSYEPITLSSAEDYRWIEQIMGRLGYSGGAFSATRNYANARRIATNRQWGVVIFVVDSLNDLDGKFSNGGFGYAYLNGPYMVMTYDNDGWGISRMEIVTAHELGHIFGALDEYADSKCTTSQRSGYLNIANTNCENGSPTETSIMRNAVNQEAAYPNHLASTPVRGMIGWRDSDNDGLYDPLDTTPSLSLTAYSPDPATTAWPQYAGSTQDVPYNSTTRADATINTIAAVQYRVDGGTWQDCAPADGAFNTWQEGFTCAAGPLSEGTHTIQSRSRNSANNYSATAADTLTVDTVAPLNPLTVTPGCTAASNVWQNSCGNPAFTWSGASDATSGVAGYQLYWGTSVTGTATTWLTTAAYDPAAVSPGNYYLRLRTKDNAGNWSAWATPFILRYDNISPTVQITAPLASSYLNAPTITVQATGSDAHSGLARFRFYAGYDDDNNDNTNNWAWHDLGYDTNGTDGWQQSWTTAGVDDQTGVAFYTYGWDQAGNYTGASVGNLVLDRTPPVSAVQPLTATLPSTRFKPTWAGTDALAGLAGFDVQYRTDSGGWQDWRTNLLTTTTSAWFTGQMGQTYYFQARARDLAGNLEAYPGGNGDTQVYIPLCTGDSHEVDDTYQTATPLAADGTPQSHTICGVGDQDWVVFAAQADQAYLIETGNLPAWTDTYLRLYGPDGQTQLAENDDIAPGSNRASRIKWIARADGLYYVKIHDFNNAAGDGVTYELTITPTTNFEVYLPLLLAR